MNAVPRFHQIDFLRGMACLGVVAFHFLHRGQQGGWLVDPVLPWLQSAASLGHLGVHLFFMVSGFVILMTAEGATVRSFIASRVSRLYPAFWVGVLLTAAVAWWSGSTVFAVTPVQVLVNLTMVPQWVQVEFVDGAYWSLAVELQFYLLVIALLHFGQMRRVEWWIAAWLLVSSVNAVRRMYPLEFWLDARWAPLFAAGMLFYRISRKGWNGRRYLLLLWAFSLTLWYGWSGAVESKLGHEVVGLGLPLVVVLCLTLFHAVFLAIISGWWTVRASPLVYWFGALTYPVYLLHQNIGYLALTAPLAVWQALDFHLRVLLVVAGVVGMSWLVNRWIERPLSKRLRAAIDPAGARRPMRSAPKLRPGVLAR
ncbi:acyltransferase [Sphaerotilus sp.]|uniref:acyltransferase family protein n=1 Tax=Sphaerotilus sp. TaxID=2093942 RepID=UPI00286E0813|nr:acyltransferase [Sphaerotilus sp.]